MYFHLICLLPDASATKPFGSQTKHVGSES
jgi:hypothetical protein